MPDAPLLSTPAEMIAPLDLSVQRRRMERPPSLN